MDLFMKKLLRTPAILAVVAWACSHVFLHAESEVLAPPAAEPEQAAEATPKSMQEALEKLQLPGIKINTELWSVDVDATVSLHHGLLELIACIKDTKEHESVVAVNAKPSHIHTALLLIGAAPGNPAMRRVVGEGDEARFIDLPPRGGMVDVYLVIDTPEGKKEFPINRFIEKAPEDFFENNPEKDQEENKEPELYPTHSFMFTGSVLVEQGDDQPRQYVADYSGNVITISTFGDEVLGTPEVHDDSNHSLVWQVRSDGLPEVDSPIILRLKPQRAEKPQDAEKDAGE